MRIYEGDYAYEIEPVVDPATQVSAGWRYKVYRIRPLEQLLRSGDAQSKEAAEESGRRALDEVLKRRSTSHEPAA
jgi:hypothetical protein